MAQRQNFTIGIEEEYLLVDPVSRDLAAEPPAELLEECQRRITAEIGHVAPEFLRAQLEVDTPVCRSLAECREKLSALRGLAACAAENHGLRIIAASTHPFAEWDRAAPHRPDRYNMLARDLQGVARRLLICGMHVHIGIPDDEICASTCMNQLGYFLPHLLALSTSSPFWQGRQHRAQELSPQPCSTSCRARACRKNSTATANTSATSPSW